MNGQIVPEAAAGMREFSQPQVVAPSSLGFDAKVFVGIEHSEAQAVGFSLIGKLFGQGGAYTVSSYHFPFLFFLYLFVCKRITYLSALCLFVQVAF